MLTVKETNKLQIENKIRELLDKGTYKTIDDLFKVNPNLDTFIFNTKMNYISYSFSSQFTNDDYLELIKQLKENLKMQQNEKEGIKETVVNNNVFVDIKNENDESKTLVGVDQINLENNNNVDTFNQEGKFEKREARFEELNDIDITKLTEHELTIFQTVLQEPDADTYKIYIDENGKLTNTVVNANQDYFSIENIDGQLQFREQESNNKTQENIAKQKVYSLSNKSTGNAAFANILILSFIIGSFFGIIFLAIYQQVMR